MAWISNDLHTKQCSHGVIVHVYDTRQGDTNSMVGGNLGLVVCFVINSIIGMGCDFTGTVRGQNIHEQSTNHISI